MDNSLATGSVAVFAVSGSVVLLALQVHKRLLSDFMKKMEFEIGTSKKIQPKKRVRFADDDVVVQPPFFGDNKAGTRRLATSGCPTRVVREKILDDLPQNWQALYKGIMENRVLNNLKLM